MVVPMLLIALLSQGTEKQLPPVAEPDWDAFQSVKPDARKEMAKHWELLRKARPDFKYQDEA